MEKLFEKRCKVLATDSSGQYYSCNWPVGKVIFYRDHLIVKALMKDWQLAYNDIDCMETNFAQVEIIHHNPDVIKEIMLEFFFLPKSIKEGVRKHGLPIVFKK